MPGRCMLPIVLVLLLGSPAARAAWIPNGLMLSTGTVQEMVPAAISDGVGGALVARIVFDARADDGALLPTGVYFYRVSANGQTRARKMVIAR